MVFGDDKHFEWFVLSYIMLLSRSLIIELPAFVSISRVKGKTVSTEPTALTSISAIHWYSKATGMSELR